MNASEPRELQAKTKQAAAPASPNSPELVFTPPVDIFETEKELTLLADMPGVKPDDLSIDLKADTLTLSGEIAPFEEAEEEDILIEYEIGRYHRQFTLPEVIDKDRIDAKLENGVLRLGLPKMEKAAPRQIMVKAT